MPASNPDPQPGHPAAAAAATPEAEAARYALLRRLAPSMRHHLVVNLQPIGMIHEVMERRLRSAQPDLAHVHDSAAKINTFARAALASCIDVVGWLAPDEEAGIAVDDAVRECASLLATSLSFRGYALHNEVVPLAGQVQRCAIRNLLTAALVHASDHLEPGAALAITAKGGEQGATVRLAVDRSERDKGFVAELGYRKLVWRDLEAMAAADRVDLRREGQGLVLLFPWWSAPRG